MQKSSYTILIILFSTLVLVGYVAYSTYVTDGDKKDSEAAALFGEQSEATFTDLEGNPIKLSDYAGKIRIVNTWASWSPFSLKELNDFQTLTQEFVDQDIVVIAINRMETKQRAKSFIDHSGDFKNILFVLDPKDTFYTSVGGFSMPETLFYDASGTQVAHKRGQMTLEQMREQLQQILTSE